MDGKAQAPDVAEVNSLLAAWRAGDKGAYNRLTEILHADLVRIAHLKFRGERVSHTLETHALVNNLYLKLFRTETVPWRDYLHFLNSAARSMNRLLIDHARSWGSKVQGNAAMISDTHWQDLGVADAGLDEYLALDQALAKYAELDPKAAVIAELRVLGLTFEEIAGLTELELSKVKREWKLIRKYLLKKIYREGEG